MKTAFFILTLILQTLITIIPLLGKLSDNRKRIPQNLTKLGRVLVVVSTLAILSTITQTHFSDKESNLKESLSKRELTRRDSLHEIRERNTAIELMKRVDSSKQTTTKLLLDYHLAVDSGNNKIVKVLRDSARNTNYYGSDPDFSICLNNGIIIDNYQHNDVNSSYFYTVKVNMCNNLAVSKNIDLKLYILGKDDRDSLLYLNKEVVTASSVSAGAVLSKEYVLQGTKTKTSELYIYIKGVYKNSDYTKKLKLDEVFFYNFQNKTVGIVGFKESEKVKDLLAAKKIV